MKQLLFFLVAFCFPAFLFSQISFQMGSRRVVKYETLDNGALRIFYETKSVKDVTKPDKTDTDFMVLDIGEKGISRFYSDNRRRTDSIMNELMKSGGPVNINQNTLSNSGISSMGDSKEIFKNYPSGKITVTDRIANSDYLYEEDKINFQWQIESDSREILSYTCQKAVTDFRGRHYEVWFAPDLPLNDGPWKFAGLPGLIMAAEDLEKNFIFQAIGIENYNNPVEFPKKDYVKTSRNEVEKIQKRFVEDPSGYLSNSMPGARIIIKTIDESGVEKTGSEVKFPYNPMELE